MPIVRRVLRESLPVLVVAGIIDLLAGVLIEGNLESFLRFGALVVLIPPFLEDTGALGSVLASRLASKLHLGTIEPTARPGRPARADFAVVAILAIPVFALVGTSAHVVAVVVGQESPGLLDMIGVALIGGSLATALAMAIAYYGSIATYRLGLDPDNYGVPLLTSSMDLVGAFSLVLGFVLLRIA
jgi:mgtE-like transporter